jgi:hypothetical protein
MIKIVNDIIHIGSSLPGTANACTIHFVYTLGMTVVFVRKACLPIRWTDSRHQYI